MSVWDQMSLVSTYNPCCCFNIWLQLCQCICNNLCLLTQYRLSHLSTDFSVIVEALRKSKTGLMEISEDKTKIRRSPNKPLPELNEQYKAAIRNRSVYVVSKVLPWLCAILHDFDWKLFKESLN